MPNWCGNIVKIKGPKSERDRFVADMKAAGVAAYPDVDAEKAPCFTFYYAAPMPSEYKQTTSPTPWTEQETREMAEKYQWDANTVQFKLEHCLTPEQREFYDSLIAKHGSENWYDWCCRNWGTKWDACHESMGETPRMTVFSFDTAWGPPLEFAEKFVKKILTDYKGLTVRWEYSLEGETGDWVLVDDKIVKESVDEILSGVSPIQLG